MLMQRWSSTIYLQLLYFLYTHLPLHTFVTQIVQVASETEKKKKKKLKSPIKSPKEGREITKSLLKKEKKKPRWIPFNKP